MPRRNPIPLYGTPHILPSSPFFPLFITLFLGSVAPSLRALLRGEGGLWGARGKGGVSLFFHPPKKKVLPSWLTLSIKKKPAKKKQIRAGSLSLDKGNSFYRESYRICVFISKLLFSCPWEFSIGDAAVVVVGGGEVLISLENKAHLILQGLKERGCSVRRGFWGPQGARRPPSPRPSPPRSAPPACFGERWGGGGRDLLPVLPLQNTHYIIFPTGALRLALY